MTYKMDFELLSLVTIAVTAAAPIVAVAAAAVVPVVDAVRGVRMWDGGIGVGPSIIICLNTDGTRLTIIFNISMARDRMLLD